MPCQGPRSSAIPSRPPRCRHLAWTSSSPSTEVNSVSTNPGSVHTQAAGPEASPLSSILSERSRLGGGAAKTPRTEPSGGHGRREVNVGQGREKGRDCAVPTAEARRLDEGLLFILGLGLRSDLGPVPSIPGVSVPVCEIARAVNNECQGFHLGATRPRDQPRASRCENKAPCSFARRKREAAIRRVAGADDRGPRQGDRSIHPWFLFGCRAA